MNRLESLMNPESAALIGVSRNAEQSVFHSLKTLKKYGYKGKIYVIHPKAEEILGFKTIKSIKELPMDVDVLIITLPKGAVLPTVKEAVERRVKNVVIVTQGFADLDEAGKLLQDEIVHIAKAGRTRVLGPNTLGVSNSFSRFTTVISPLEWETPFPVAWICQTGVFVVGFSKVAGKRIDIGNGADIQFDEALDHFSVDPEAKLINAQIESLAKGRIFMEAAKRAASNKPVFVLKTGRSKIGALAAASHSGALAGEDEVYDAAFRQCGVIRVEDIDELADLNHAFLNLSPMGGKNIAVLTVSGGLGIIAADACERYNLHIAELSPQTISRIKQLSPDWISISNPVDIWPGMSEQGYEYVYREAMEALTKDENVHGILCILYAFDFQANPEIDVRKIIKEFTQKGIKPVATWYYGPFTREMEQDSISRDGIVTFPSPDRAMRALSALYRYENICKPLTLKPNGELTGVEDEVKKKVSEIIQTAGQYEGRDLGLASFEILGLYGIPVLQSKLVGSLKEAVDESEKVGFPIALKIVSPTVSHKSDIGGIRLNITNRADLERAYENLLTELKSKKLNLQISGVLLQPMAKGKEIIIGIKYDPSFGPVVVYGMGGIYTEILKDVSFRVAPVDSDEAKLMIEETKSYNILKGMRGETPVAISSIADAIARLSSLAVDFPQISEIDINPFIVNSEKGYAVDARIFLRNPEK